MRWTQALSEVKQDAAIFRDNLGAQNACAGHDDSFSIPSQLLPEPLKTERVEKWGQRELPDIIHCFQEKDDKTYVLRKTEIIKLIKSNSSKVTKCTDRLVSLHL